MTREELDHIFAKEPLLAINHGTVCIRGYELAQGDMRSLLGEKIAGFASLVFRLAYAAAPKSGSGTPEMVFRVYQPK